MDSKRVYDTSAIADLVGLAKFIAILSEEVEIGGLAIENTTVHGYLEALSRWIEDSDGHYQNNGIDTASINPWRRIADAAVSALFYE